MSDALRMDLADCGSPERLIDVILKHHPEWHPPVPIEELAFAVGIEEFRDLELERFEGALMTDADKSRGVILTKAGAREERRRFTIGHELGHFLLPSHKGDRQCTSKDLREKRQDNNHRRQEAEANRFSADVLMPRRWFARDMAKLGEADVTHTQILSDRYNTSLEATINRYVDLTSDICAFVFSKDYIVRYVRKSRDFPHMAVARGDALPEQSISSDVSAGALREPTSWQEVDGSTWLNTRWGERALPVLEQTMRQGNGFQVTLLLIEPEPYEDDGEELEEDWDPRF